MALQTLDLLDDRAVRGVIQEFVVSNLRRWDASATAGEVLGLLTRDGRHQELLDAALERLGGYLGTEEVRERASNLLVKFARKEWPRIIAAVDVIASVDGIADNLADRLARALVQELREVLSQPDHPVRQDYEGWLQDYIGRLRSDPALAAQPRRSSSAPSIIRRCRNTCADCGTTSMRRCGATCPRRTRRWPRIWKAPCWRWAAGSRRMRRCARR